MKKIPIALVNLTVAILMIGACHKPEDLQTHSNYRFTNTLKEAVTIDFYENRDDYTNNEHILSSYRIQPGATTSITLQALKTYWMDWYTPGYSYSNWKDSFNTDEWQGWPRPEITAANEDDFLIVQSNIRDTVRSVLLQANGISSTWKISVNAEPVVSGAYAFHFKKDFSGDYTFTDLTGKSTITPISYHIISYPRVDEKASDFEMVIQKAPNVIVAWMDFQRSVNSAFFTHSRDSLVTTFRDIGTGKHYWAVRQ